MCVRVTIDRFPYEVNGSEICSQIKYEREKLASCASVYKYNYHIYNTSSLNNSVYTVDVVSNCAG